MIESNPIVNCKDLKIKEVLTIGNIDDYEDWRHNKGDYDYSGRAGMPGVGVIKGITYPVPAVNPMDIAHVWEAMISPREGSPDFRRTGLPARRQCRGSNGALHLSFSVEGGGPFAGLGK